MTSSGYRRRELLHRIENKVRVLTSELVHLPEPSPNRANLIELGVPDVWTEIFSPSGEYWGRMIRHSNGAASYMNCSYIWDRDYPLRAESHFHIHEEFLFVLEGRLVVKTPHLDELEIGPGQKITIPAREPHSTIVDPGTRMTVIWFDKR